MKKFIPTKQTKVKRAAVLANYDQKIIYDIIDKGILAHIAFIDDGLPNIIPISYGRIDDEIIFHGSNGSRLIKVLASGTDVSINITLLDGLVFGRSIFNHSMNYHSACLYGKGRLIEDKQAILDGLYVISEQCFPGRWDEARLPNKKELAATSVVAVKIEDAVAKIRENGPGHVTKDLDLDIWAGEIPLTLSSHNPIDDKDLKKNIAPTTSIKDMANKTDVLKHKIEIRL